MARKFHLFHSVVGCPDIKVEENMYFQRLSGSSQKGIQAKVGCTKTQDSWTLRCVSRNWVGQIGNCSSSKHCLVTLYHAYKYLTLIAQDSGACPKSHKLRF